MTPEVTAVAGRTAHHKGIDVERGVLNGHGMLRGRA
jgi:hypothetical protein